MKKITALLLSLFLLLSMTALLPACGSEDAKTVYEKAEKTMTALKSYTMKSDMDTTVTFMGTTMKVPVKSEGFVDAKNKKLLYTTTTETMGVSSESKIYMDSEVYMLETMGMKYMSKVGDKLSELMKSYGSAMDISFDSFNEPTIKKENGKTVITIKGLKEGTDISALLGSAGSSVLGEDSAEMLDAIKGLDTIALTLYVDNTYRYTAIDVSMSLTIDSSKFNTTEDGFGSGDFDFGSGDFDFGSGDFDFGSGDFDFGSGDFDFGSGDFNFDLGEISMTISGSITFSDFDAAADKVVKPSTEGYEEIDLDEILSMSSNG